MRCGVTAAYLSRVERGDVAPPGEETLIKLAHELGEDPDVMLAMAGKISADLRTAILARPQLLGRKSVDRLPTDPAHSGLRQDLRELSRRGEAKPLVRLRILAFKAGYAELRSLPPNRHRGLPVNLRTIAANALFASSGVFAIRQYAHHRREIGESLPSPQRALFAPSADHATRQS